jgi:hypothetical protein
MKRMVMVTMMAIATSVLVSGTLACDNKGPMEKAGEKVDETVDKLTHPNEGPLEKAARKTEEAVEDAKEKVD